MYSVGRNGPSTSSWTPHLRTRGALYEDPSATLDDLREAVATLEETARVTRRVLGGAHPLTADIEERLREARVTLRTRETAEKTP